MRGKDLFVGASLIVLLFLIIYFWSFVFSNDVISKVDTSKKILYLTFDDGPGPYTKQVLNFLDAKQVPATFFLVGERVKENQEIVRRMVRDGHAVGSHSFSHPFLFRNVEEEIYLGKLAVDFASGKSSTLFRAPYGFVFPWTLNKANNLGLKTVQWSCFPRDYSASSSEVIVSRVNSCLSPGAIIVLHPWNHEQSLKSLPDIVSFARSQGYEFRTLDDLN